MEKGQSCKGPERVERCRTVQQDCGAGQEGSAKATRRQTDRFGFQCQDSPTLHLVNDPMSCGPDTGTGLEAVHRPRVQGSPGAPQCSCSVSALDEREKAASRHTQLAPRTWPQVADSSGLKAGPHRPPSQPALPREGSGAPRAAHKGGISSGREGRGYCAPHPTA